MTFTPGQKYLYKNDKAGKKLICIYIKPSTLFERFHTVEWSDINNNFISHVHEDLIFEIAEPNEIVKELLG